jgi:hypothetical protein
MQSIHKKSIISTAVTKYLNSLFKLSEFRKTTDTKSNDQYLKIFGQPENITQSENQDLRDIRRPFQWQPMFHFDSLNLINKLFGNLDLDMQNTMNSFVSASTISYGVCVHENNFGNVTAYRESRPRQDRTSPGTFVDFMNRYLATFNLSTGLRASVLPPADVYYGLGSIFSAKPFNAKKFKNAEKLKESQSYYNKALLALQESISKLATRAAENYQTYGRERQPPCALFFSVLHAESNNSYNMYGRRDNIPESERWMSTLRDKSGIYMAIHIGQNSVSYGTDLQPVHPDIKDLIDTGVFGPTESITSTQFAFPNILITKLSPFIFKYLPLEQDTHRRDLSNNPQQQSYDGTANTLWTGDSLSVELPQIFTPVVQKEDIGTDSARYKNGTQINCEQRQSRYSSDASINIGPLIHIIHPESFKRLVTYQRPLEDDEDMMIQGLDNPINKQEWLNLKFDSHDWSFNGVLHSYKPTLESNDPKLRKLTQPLDYRPYWFDANSRDREFSHNPRNELHPGANFSDVCKFGWILHNTPTCNRMDLVTTGRQSWVSLGRPVPGPIHPKDVSGMVTVGRSSKNPVRDTVIKWAWTNFGPLNTEKYCTSNIRDCFMDYAVSSNSKDRGKGKVFVGHDDVAYCPISGEALVVTSLLVSPMSSVQDYYSRSNLQTSSAVKI